MVLERIRSEEYDWSALVPELTVTVSIGVAEIANEDTIAYTFERADGALYETKQAGRNGVHAALDPAVA